MLKKIYKQLSGLLNWRLAVAAVLALGGGILLGRYSTPSSGVLGGLLCLEVFCAF